MHFGRPSTKTEYYEEGSSSSEHESSQEEPGTLDHELPEIQLEGKSNVAELRPVKPVASPTYPHNPRGKANVRPSKTIGRASFEEIVNRNNYFQDKLHIQMEASEISMIEKVASVMNKTDEYIMEEASQAEHTPQNTKPPTKIPNFGLLSKFSPNKNPNNSLNISSPMSQTDDAGERKDTEDYNKPTVERVSQGIPNKQPKVPSIQFLEQPDPSKNKQPVSSGRNLVMETPGFRREQKKQTETSSNNPDSVDDPITNVYAREEVKSRVSQSEIGEVHSKKLNESAIGKRQNLKKATFFTNNDSKNGHIIPGYTRYVLDENINQQQVYMPHLSDREIFDAFSALDMNKDGYITADEIAYFLEVLEENATEAEIEEMIRMLDYEGMGKVRYDEFHKLATGKNVNPIGQAYPPTLDLFEKTKNVDGSYGKAQRNRDFTDSGMDSKDKKQTLRKGLGMGDHVNTSSKEYGKIDTKLSRLPRLGDLGDEVKQIKTDKDERDSYFKGFIRQAGIGTKTFTEKYDIVLFSNENKITKATYKDFLGFFFIDDQDVTKKLFSLIGKDRNYIDMRQVMIALSLYLDFSMDEKINLAYDLYDPDGHGYILYNELMKIFKMFQLGEEHKRIERKIITILNRRSIMPEDSIPKEEFILICKNFPDLFN